MRRILVSALALVAAVTLSSVTMALFTGGGMHAVRNTVELVLPAGIAWLALVHASLRVRRLGTFRLQYGLAVASAVGVALIAVFWTADRMFVSDHDAGVLASLMLFAGVIGARIAMLLADRTAHDVETLGAGLETFAAGDLSHRIEPAGPRELRDLAVSANEMAEELERMRAERDDADRARRNLIASVSHDLRTPLTSLRLLVEAIDDGVVEGPAETADALRRAKGHVATLSTLVDDLFELARLEAGRHLLDALAGRRRRADRRDRRGVPSAGRAEGPHADRERPERRRAGARQPREAAARAVQPRAERRAPHTAGRHGEPARRARRTTSCASRSPTTARASPPSRPSRSSSASSAAATARATARARPRALDQPRDRRGARRQDLGRAARGTRLARDLHGPAATAAS